MILKLTQKLNKYLLNNTTPVEKKDYKTIEPFTLNFGSLHPLAHGVLRLFSTLCSGSAFIYIVTNLLFLAQKRLEVLDFNLGTFLTVTLFLLVFMIYLWYFLKNPKNTYTITQEFFIWLLLAGGLFIAISLFYVIYTDFFRVAYAMLPDSVEVPPKTKGNWLGPLLFVGVAAIGLVFYGKHAFQSRVDQIVQEKKKWQAQCLEKQNEELKEVQKKLQYLEGSLLPQPVLPVLPRANAADNADRVSSHEPASATDTYDGVREKYVNPADPEE